VPDGKVSKGAVLCDDVGVGQDLAAERFTVRAEPHRGKAGRVE
jgi:hypothetical protein